MRRILIVDDQRSLRDMIRDVLLDAGFTTVDEATDGEVALAKLRDCRYELMITDWNMPRMNGLDLLKAVRATPSLKPLPVIMLTGESAREQVVEAIKLGVTGFVKKPFNVVDLIDTVRRVFPESDRAA